MQYNVVVDYIMMAHDCISTILLPGEYTHTHLYDQVLMKHD